MLRNCPCKHHHHNCRHYLNEWMGGELSASVLLSMFIDIKKYCKWQFAMHCRIFRWCAVCSVYNNEVQWNTAEHSAVESRVDRILILDQDQSRCIVLLTVDKIRKCCPKIGKIKKKSESCYHSCAERKTIKLQY